MNSFKLSIKLISLDFVVFIIRGALVTSIAFFKVSGFSNFNPLNFGNVTCSTIGGVTGALVVVAGFLQGGFLKSRI